jgi:tRNA threonylcarbamoyladenosine modification (KEOPS) complex  Pcc1 subunit
MSHTRSCKAEVRLAVPDGTVEAILGALTPETGSPSSDRSDAELERIPGGIVIRAYASDTSAMRAALNSYLRWVQGIVETVEGLK